MSITISPSELYAGQTATVTVTGAPSFSVAPCGPSGDTNYSLLADSLFGSSSAVAKVSGYTLAGSGTSGQVGVTSAIAFMNAVSGRTYPVMPCFDGNATIQHIVGDGAGGFYVCLIAGAPSGNTSTTVRDSSFCNVVHVVPNDGETIAGSNLRLDPNFRVNSTFSNAFSNAFICVATPTMCITYTEDASTLNGKSGVRLFGVPSTGTVTGTCMASWTYVDVQATAASGSTTLTVTSVSGGLLGVGAYVLVASDSQFIGVSRISALGTGLGGPGTYTLAAAVTANITVTRMVVPNTLQLGSWETAVVTGSFPADGITFDVTSVASGFIRTGSAVTGSSNATLALGNISVAGQTSGTTGGAGSYTLNLLASTTTASSASGRTATAATFTGLITGSNLTVTAVSAGWIGVGLAFTFSDGSATITALGTGLGSVGTYTVSVTGTSPSGSTTFTTGAAGSFTASLSNSYLNVTVAPSSGTLTVGQTLSLGTNLVIVSQVSGRTGGVGVYSIARLPVQTSAFTVTSLTGSDLNVGGTGALVAATLTGSLSNTTLTVSTATANTIVVGSIIACPRIGYVGTVTAFISASGGAGTYTLGTAGAAGPSATFVVLPGSVSGCTISASNVVSSAPTFAGSYPSSMVISSSTTPVCQLIEPELISALALPTFYPSSDYQYYGRLITSVDAVDSSTGVYVLSYIIGVANSKFTALPVNNPVGSSPPASTLISSTTFNTPINIAGGVRLVGSTYISFGFCVSATTVYAYNVLTKGSSVAALWSINAATFLTGATEVVNIQMHPTKLDQILMITNQTTPAGVFAVTESTCTAIYKLSASYVPAAISQLQATYTPYLLVLSTSTTSTKALVNRGAVVTASVSGTTMTVTNTSAGPLEVGQYLFGTGVTTGTTIVAAGAAGGNGTYTLNNSLSLSSQTISAYAVYFTGYVVGNVLTTDVVSYGVVVSPLPVATTAGWTGTLMVDLSASTFTATPTLLSTGTVSISGVTTATGTVSYAQILTVASVTGTGTVTVGATVSWTLGGVTNTAIVDFFGTGTGGPGTYYLTSVQCGNVGSVGSPATFVVLPYDTAYTASFSNASGSRRWAVPSVLSGSQIALAVGVSSYCTAPYNDVPGKLLPSSGGLMILDSQGTIKKASASSYSAGFNNAVTCIEALPGAPNLFNRFFSVGGSFTSITLSGTSSTRTRWAICGISPTTGILSVTSFDVGSTTVPSTVNALAVYAADTDTTVQCYCAGVGTVYALVKATWNGGSHAGAVAWSTSLASGNSIRAVAVNSSLVVIGGTLTSVNGSSRTNLAILAASDGTLQSWDAGSSASTATIQALALNNDGSAVAVGYSAGTVFSAPTFLVVLSTSSATLLWARPVIGNIPAALTASVNGPTVAALRTVENGTKLLVAQQDLRRSATNNQGSVLSYTWASGAATFASTVGTSPNTVMTVTGVPTATIPVGAAVNTGTWIKALGTGIGGVGTYVLNALTAAPTSTAAVYLTLDTPSVSWLTNVSGNAGNLASSTAGDGFAFRPSTAAASLYDGVDGGLGGWIPLGLADTAVTTVARYPTPSCTARFVVDPSAMGTQYLRIRGPTGGKALTSFGAPQTTLSVIGATLGWNAGTTTTGGPPAPLSLGLTNDNNTETMLIAASVSTTAFMDMYVATGGTESASLAFTKTSKDLGFVSRAKFSTRCIVYPYVLQVNSTEPSGDVVATVVRPSIAVVQQTVTGAAITNLVDASITVYGLCTLTTTAVYRISLTDSTFNTAGVTRTGTGTSPLVFASSPVLGVTYTPMGTVTPCITWSGKVFLVCTASSNGNAHIVYVNLANMTLSAVDTGVLASEVGALYSIDSAENVSSLATSTFAVGSTDNTNVSITRVRGASTATTSISEAEFSLYGPLFGWYKAEPSVFVTDTTLTNPVSYQLSNNLATAAVPYTINTQGQPLTQQPTGVFSNDTYLVLAFTSGTSLYSTQCFQFTEAGTTTTPFYIASAPTGNFSQFANQPTIYVDNTGAGPTYTGTLYTFTP